MENAHIFNIISLIHNLLLIKYKNSKFFYFFYLYFSLISFSFDQNRKINKILSKAGPLQLKSKLSKRSIYKTSPRPIEIRDCTVKQRLKDSRRRRRLRARSCCRNNGGWGETTRADFWWNDAGDPGASAPGGERGGSARGTYLCFPSFSQEILCTCFTHSCFISYPYLCIGYLLDTCFTMGFRFWDLLGFEF